MVLSRPFGREIPKGFVSYLLDEGVGSYHIFRPMFAADSIVSMDVWGIEKETGHFDQLTYATWSVDVQPLPPTLIIRRISAIAPEFPGLLRQIQAAGRKRGIGKVEIWNVPKHLLNVVAKTGDQIVERKEGLPAIKWYSVGNTADVEWVSTRSTFLLELNNPVGVENVQEMHCDLVRVIMMTSARSGSPLTISTVYLRATHIRAWSMKAR